MLYIVVQQVHIRQEKYMIGIIKYLEENVNCSCKKIDLEYKAIYALICEHSIDINQIKVLFPLEGFFRQIKQM